MVQDVLQILIILQAGTITGVYERNIEHLNNLRRPFRKANDFVAQEQRFINIVGHKKNCLGKLVKDAQKKSL